MYNRYFGFKENPFSIAPDPRFLFMSEMHQDALAHLKYGVSSDGCIILLTGEIGTGKTTICRCFLEQLGNSTDVAVILNPKLNALELLATICDEFQIPASERRSSVKHYIDRLNKFLLHSHAQNRRCLLVIDEAQNLNKDVLEMVRLLTNLETNTRKLLKIFLLGQSELSKILAHPDMIQIDQRITGRFHLRGLQSSDMDGYVRHRIIVAGGGETRTLFDTKASKRIHKLSGGIPRLINNLCDRSLLGAYAGGKDSVDVSIVKKAGLEIFGSNSFTRNSKIALRALTIASVTALLVAFLMVVTIEDYSPFKLKALWHLPASEQSSVDPTGNQQAKSQSLGSKSAPETGSNKSELLAEDHAEGHAKHSSVSFKTESTDTRSLRQTPPAYNEQFSKDREGASSQPDNQLSEFSGRGDTKIVIQTMKITE